MSNSLDSHDQKISATIRQIFQFLRPPEIEILLNKAKKIDLNEDEFLFHEGDLGNSFYIVLSGKLRSTKHVGRKKVEYALIQWKPNDTIGEISLIEKFPRGVTCKAIKPTTLLEFKVDDIQQHPDIFNKVSHYFTRKTAERLRFLAEITAHSMEKQLEENKKRKALGLLMVTVLTITCIYMLSLPFLENASLHLPITTIISAPLVLILTAIMIVVMKKSGFPWKTYGINFKNWRRHSLEALLFSLPVIAILTLMKWLIIYYVLKNPSIPVFNPKSSVPGQFSWGLYFLSLLVYVIIAPGQELIVRGALQSGFYIFLSGKRRKRMWVAIIISNLIFSIPHLYESTYFALLVLIPGIFWGWLYARQKTLVGVSVSHIFIGVWMVFIVGFENLLLLLGSSK